MIIAQTRDEDVADNSGAKISYNAYEKWIQRNGEDRKLPGLDFTPKQLFWISTAQFFCDASRPEMNEFVSLTNEHTVSKFRIIGTMSNMMEFASDFNCSVNAKMNPEEKCSIW